jgi:hypothetical protein
MEKLNELILKAEQLLNVLSKTPINNSLDSKTLSEVKSIYVQGRLLIKKVDKTILEEYSKLFSNPPDKYYQWDVLKRYTTVEFEKCLGILKAISESDPEIVFDKSLTNIFISHGKFNPSFYNLELFIRALGCIPIFDINEPTEGKTINQLVNSLMQKADFYIILACSETTNDSGKKLPNHNVIIEYDRLIQSKIDKMIVFLEEGCHMPSMVQEVIYVQFTNECMDKAFTKLVSELKIQNLL